MADIKFDIDRMKGLTKKQSDLAKQTIKKTSLMYEMGPKSDMPAPKSHNPMYKSYSPSGGGLKKFPADIGVMGQTEMRKVFPKFKNPGPTTPNPLHYRKPAIEGGEGPHAV